MADLTKASPRPWVVENATIFALNEAGTNRFSAHMQGGWIRRGSELTTDEELRANAALTVAAVNAYNPARDAAYDALVEAVRKAKQLVDIATDWNLDEVEIDGEMVRTHSLGDEFGAALGMAEQADGQRGPATT